MTPTSAKSKIDEYYYASPMTVFGFFKEYRFLSNFHLCPVVYEGLQYTSSEAAFQAAKCANPIDRMPFTTMTPAESKAAGQKVNLRRDWSEVKLKVMMDVLYSKFSINDDIRTLLLDTEYRQLHEANHWNDKFWGIDYLTYSGEDWLGKILMAIRKTFSTINKKQPNEHNQ